VAGAHTRTGAPLAARGCSGHRAPENAPPHATVSTPLPRAAALFKASLDLRLGCGTVVAVPIPAEHEAAGREVKAAIAEALREAERRGVRGAAVGPA
jgi:pseudouridine-5'-phosphate glycosidase